MREVEARNHSQISLFRDTAHPNFIVGCTDSIYTFPADRVLEEHSLRPLDRHLVSLWALLLPLPRIRVSARFADVHVVAMSLAKKLTGSLG